MILGYIGYAIWQITIKKIESNLFLSSKSKDSQPVYDRTRLNGAHFLSFQFHSKNEIFTLTQI